jgi:mannose-6-phosphate isomerase-like protein (cupin superfamily)
MRKYERFVIQNPIITEEYLYHGKPEEPFRIYMSSDLVPEANAFADVFWRTVLPTPNPTCELHAHPYPQLLMFVGEEGSFEVEVPLNDEMYVITKTTVIWIPPGVIHNVKYNRIDRPMMESGILIGNGKYL